jgi:hypothetical protein
MQLPSDPDLSVTKGSKPIARQSPADPFRMAYD